MKKKITFLIAATVLGFVVGALLGYGPLLRYKSEGVLNIDMGTSEYKRFTELANDANSINQYLKINPIVVTKDVDISSLAKTVIKGEWHKPVPKVSKLDAKELTDAVLQMERDSEKEKEILAIKEGARNRKPTTVYLGLRLSYVDNDSQTAANVTTWLGNYFKEVATREAVREQVSRWAAENSQFSDRALEQKLKYEFEIEQARARVASLKKITAAYPDTLGKVSNQVIDVRKDNEKFISPTAQLVGSETEIIDINEKIKKLGREMDQQMFASNFLEQAKTAVTQAQSGSESVAKLAAMLALKSKNIKSDAEKEKLLSFTADLSQISARFLTQAQFIAQPSVATRPERPTPLMYTVLSGVLFMLISALYLWRDKLINLLKQSTENV